MEESIVKVEHLSHRYSVQWAIRDINFEITKNGYNPVSLFQKMCSNQPQ